VKTTKHPLNMTTSDTAAIVAAFDAHDDGVFTVADVVVLTELRDAAAARRAADVRIEAAVREAHQRGMSWGLIGAQLGMTRQGARQRFDRIIN
jgi:hypothetical protein